MNGMMALRTILFFILTSLLSACVGLVLVLAIHPGDPDTKNILGSGTTEQKKVYTSLDTINCTNWSMIRWTSWTTSLISAAISYPTTYSRLHLRR